MREEFKQVAIEAARQAGAYLKENFGKVKRIDYKGDINLVTEVDDASEELIIEIIKSKFPDHAFLAEETGEQRSRSPYKWVIDPLDATTNYAHSFPFFCISVALEEKGRIVVGAVYEPLRDELFVAELKGGAYLNGERISVSDIAEASKALLATGFPYRVKETRANIKHFENFLLAAQAVRRAGSAALDLCYVACGRFEGFWEEELKPWDTAAGKLIVEEAGGKVTDFGGGKYSIYSKQILASNGRVHKEMMRILGKR